MKAGHIVLKLIELKKKEDLIAFNNYVNSLSRDDLKVTNDFAKALNMLCENRLSIF